LLSRQKGFEVNPEDHKLHLSWMWMYSNSSTHAVWTFTAAPSFVVIIIQFQCIAEIQVYTAGSLTEEGPFFFTWGDFVWVDGDEVRSRKKLGLYRARFLAIKSPSFNDEVPETLEWICWSFENIGESSADKKGVNIPSFYWSPKWMGNASVCPLRFASFYWSPKWKWNHIYAYSYP
jgi:hypothetical protein